MAEPSSTSRYEGVFMLEASGNNFWFWFAQLRAFAGTFNAKKTLSGEERCPDLDEVRTLKQTEGSLVLYITPARNIEKQAKWCKKDAGLQLVIFNTCPVSVVKRLRRLNSAAAMYKSLEEEHGDKANEKA